MTRETELLREAVETLRGMVDANAAKWDMPHDEFCTEYMAWSKNRARAFLAKIDAAEGEDSTVPDVTTEDAPSWYNSDMAIAWVVGYEAAQDALAASARQDGAR